MRVRSLASAANLLSLIVVIYGSIGFANELTDFPGMIPMGPERQSAEDLIYQGKTITSDEANALRAQGADISQLNPANSSLWSEPAKPQGMAPLDIQPEGEQFTLLGDSKAPVGIYQGTISKLNAPGAARTYKLLISKKSANFLLRKALGRKLGYQTPDVRHVRKLSIKFNGSFSRNQFVDDLRDATGDDVTRWVTNGVAAKDQPKPDIDVVELQDVIVEDANQEIYSIPDGVIDSERMLNRRVLQSLLVPFNLVDVPESVELFSWSSGSIFNGNIYLRYDTDDTLGNFRPSFEDARWAVRKIATLTREDFKQIVAEAEYPPEVAALALEKIISRRNLLLGLFKVQAPELPFDPKITIAPNLVNGKLLKKDYPGYGSRFAFEDPAAPLSAVEMRAFFKSRVFSAAIDNLVSQFNTGIVPATDLSQKAYDHQIGLAKDRFINFLKTGKDEKTPFGLWSTPTFAGNLIVSRDVVTGAYMGTDNLVQLADTFGYAVNAGIFVGTDGLPANLSISGQSKLSYVRTYTHIKPITSIQAALKEPFRNVIVPALKHDFAGTLDKLALVDPKSAKADELQQQLNDSVLEFKKQLQTGESVLISDGLTGLLGVSAGYGLDKAISIHAGLSGSLVNIKRLHIYRKDENTIQVYRSPSDYSVLQATVGLDAHIPIFRLGLGRKAGEAETNFYELNINPDVEKNPDALKNLQALRKLLLTNSTAALDELRKPFRIIHRFKEKSVNGQFLMFRWLNLDTMDGIQAITPEGGSKTFAYRSDAQMHGKSYEQLAVDVIDAIIKESTNSDIAVGSPGSGLPGQGLLGSSVSRRSALEAELAPSPSANPLKESFVDITYQWSGWQISKDGLMKIIKEVSDKFDFKFYPPNVLNTTQKVQFYNVQLKMSIYQEGIDAIVNMPVSKFEDALVKDAKWDYIPVNPWCPQGCRLQKGVKPVPDGIKAKSEAMLNKFEFSQAKYRKAMKEGNAADMTKYSSRMVSAVESVLNPKTFIELLGGPQNIFVKSTINGFRVGDATGDSPVISDTIGQFGAVKHTGPLRFVMNNLGMTESEFFIYWLLNKI